MRHTHLLLCLALLSALSVRLTGQSGPACDLAPLFELGRCRVVVSGGTQFNFGVTEMLEAQCGVEPGAITILAA